MRRFSSSWWARGLKPLLLKEIRELVRDPRIWIPFVISALILPVLGLVIGASMGEAIRGAQVPVKAGLVIADSSPLAREVAARLLEVGPARGVDLVVLNVSGVEEALHRALELGLECVAVLPPGFGESLEERRRPNVTVLYVVRTLSLFAPSRGARLVSLLGDVVAERLISGTGVSLDLVKKPLREVAATYIASKGVLVSGDAGRAVTSLALPAMLVPVVVMIVAVGVVQMAATATAVENEERTLEVLLTLPVDRFTILLSKLLGSFAVALIGSLLSILGFIAYFYVLPSAALSLGEPVLASLHILVGAESLAWILASLLVALFFAASLGIVVGALSSDVRIAGALSGPLVMLIFIPGYYIALADTLSLGQPLRALLYTLPITQPVILSKEAIAARLPPETPLYIAGSLLVSLLTVMLASRVFTLETLERIQRAIARLWRRRGAPR